MPEDFYILFATRSVRLFAYGFLSVILALYLAQLGLRGGQIGLLFSLALLGDVVVSLLITSAADSVGRKNMLILGALLMTAAGSVFALTSNYTLLIIAAIIGVLAPSDKDVGPFLSIEQAALTGLVPDASRTRTFARYNLAGSFAAALGALLCGSMVAALESDGVALLHSYRAVIIVYAVCGFVLVVLFGFLSSSIEVRTESQTQRPSFALHESRGVVMKLSSLFALDAFAGGFIVQSMMAYWFYLKFGLSPATLGSIFFAANILAGFSALLAARLAAKFGLVNTMVFTHIPSSILLILVPLMPDLSLAVLVLLLRFTISQMDVPTRQSYTMALVGPDERSAAAGVTTVARSVGASIAPALAGQLFASPALLSVPFFIAGGLKIIYDMLLYRVFRKVRPPEEMH